MSKKSFTQWFEQDLRVERMPMPGEIEKLPATTSGTHVINVSDEYIPSCHYAALKNPSEMVYYHWFPLNECTGHMGLNSLFAALVIMHDAERADQKVLLHCHAGINRSQTVADAYYFLRTGRHFKKHRATDSGILVNFVPENVHTEDDDSNMLQWNCQNNMLPPLSQMEKFLKLLGTKLEEATASGFSANRGGLLTQLKIDLSLQ